MKLLTLILALALAGCPLAVPATEGYPPYKTRYITTDFEADKVFIDWCVPAGLSTVTPLECQVCGEAVVEYGIFRRMSDNDVDQMLINAIKTSTVKTGEACKRKAVR